MTLRGTHQGEFNNIPATGVVVEYAGTAIDRLVDGRVVQMWHMVNMHHLMQQISGPKSATATP